MRLPTLDGADSRGTAEGTLSGKEPMAAPRRVVRIALELDEQEA